MFTRFLGVFAVTLPGCLIFAEKNFPRILEKRAKMVLAQGGFYN